MRRTCAVVVVCGLAAAGSLVRPAAGADSEAAPAPVPEARPLALVGALIRTQSDAGDLVGTVVVQDGKITALGRDVPVPGNARRLDLTGHVITPGLIDARGELRLNPAAAREGGRDANLNILDAVDPFAEDWRDAAAQGVTAVYVQPAGSNILGGSGAVLRVGPGTTAEELAVKAPAGIQAALGTAPGQTNSLARYALSEQLRGQIDAAKKYGESKPAQKDPPKELLLRALKRELLFRLEVAHEDDLRAALKLTQDFHLNTVLERLDRVPVLPPDLAASRAPLVLGPFYPSAARGARAAELRRLALDGRRWAIGTFGDPRATIGLRLHAAAAVAEGYPRDAVLRALTRGAAELLGVADKLGALAVGRSADLAVFAGDPLDPSVPVRLVLSQGAVVTETAAAPPEPIVAAAKPELPDRFPTDYILKANRLLMPSGEYESGTVYVTNGRISAHSDSSWVLPTFDLGDAPVTPGLVVAHRALAGEDTVDADAGQLRAADMLAPDDPALRSYRDGGFLSVVIAPGSGNVVAGQAAVVRLGERPTVLSGEVGPKLVLTDAARNAERFPASLAGQFEFLDQRLRGGAAKTDLYLPPAIRQTLLAQRSRGLEAARAGQQVALIEAQTRAEIRAALRLVHDHKLRGVLVGPRLLDDMVDEIRQAHIGVVTSPVRPQDPERLRHSLVALSRAGVPLAFGSGSAGELRATAAALVQGGLPRAAARRGLTAEATAVLGLPREIGRIAPGDAADFVIWDGCPLDLGSRPLAVVSRGQRVGKGS